jgi:glycerol-3-phosphate O-acyltransferase
VVHAHVSVPDEPAWPAADGRRIVFLIDAASPLEHRLLADWIARSRPADATTSSIETIPIPPSRTARRRGPIDPRLDASLAAGDDALLAPLRVAWQPAQRDGVHAVRLSDLLTFGDPRDPGRLRQAWVKRRHPDRCCIVAGEPAPVSELRERWRRAGGSDAGLTTGLSEFVARQATLALERAERRLRGARYKVPRLVHEDILARPAFRGGLARLARELGRPEDKVAHDASRYLREIAATHSTYVIDLVAHLIRFMYTQGYGEALHYDRAQLEQIYSLAQRYPVVFLPSHKSNLDHLVLQYALHENGHSRTTRSTSSSCASTSIT